MLLTLCPCVFFTTCSSIHDHTDSHCFMKLLQGQLKETLFDWPEGKSHGDMVQKSQRILQENKVAYINGEENKKKAACRFSLFVSSFYESLVVFLCVFEKFMMKHLNCIVLSTLEQTSFMLYVLS